MGTIDELMQKTISDGTEQARARTEAQLALKLDDVNFAYYCSLYDKYKRAKQSEPLKIHPAPGNKLIAYPVGVSTTPPEISSQFKYADYAQIAREYDGRFAKRTVLLLKKLQAGTGSSMTRLTYLKRPDMAERLNLPKGSEVKIGAKGTDLLVLIPDPTNPSQSVEIPIVELQLLQALQIAKQGSFSKIILQDIVGPETRSRMRQIWQKASLLDPDLTYAELFDKTPGVGRIASSFQSHVPALDESGKISFNRYAPAGHGLFAVDALRATLFPDSLPETQGRFLVSAIANGEDLNSLPDHVIVEWMVKNKIPIALVTTSKTPIDLKTGIICLIKNTETQELYLKVLDTAEAKAAGQIPLFEKLGGYVSTNLTLFNYDVLTEKLKNLSEDELLKAMAPDLVPNWKEQEDPDGVVRKYLQLEGTMGSVIMNLDRYFRNTRGEELVFVVNVEAKRRTDFFSPLKSAFDYFLQFHSDRFAIDPATYRLTHLGGDRLPSFALKDPVTKDQYYQDVMNVLDAFENVSVRELNDLQVSGQVRLKGFVLRGRVAISNETSQPFDLSRVADRLPKTRDGRPLLENTAIRWRKEGLNVKKEERAAQPAPSI